MEKKRKKNQKSDTLFIARSIAHLILLGLQVTHLLVDFYILYKHQDFKLIAIIKKLNKLLVILESLKKTLSNY